MAAIFCVYEGGLRVPLIASWPGRIKPGTTCDRLVGLNDLYATFAELAGHDVPDDTAVDSISFAPLLDDPAGEGARRNLVMQSVGPFVIREGDWKLCLCPGSGSYGRFASEPSAEKAWRAALKEYGKKPRNHKELRRIPFLQLYNLREDPGEERNVAADHPERIRKMLDLLDRQIAEGRSTPGPRMKNGRANIKTMQRVPRFVWN